MGGSSFNFNDLTDPNDKTNKQKKSNTVLYVNQNRELSINFYKSFLYGICEAPTAISLLYQ